MRLLVTPTVSDSTGPGRTQPNGRGFNLRTQIALTVGPAASTATGKDRVSNEASSPDDGALLNHQLRPALLPTPLAGDGVKSSPRQRGSKGDLTLPSAVAALNRPDTTPVKA
ncbi:hypothetical protein QBC98_007453 [Kitasatospora acidiphila]